jgi:hypothetical protein
LLLEKFYQELYITEAETRKTDKTFYCFGILITFDLKQPMRFEEHWIPSILYWDESSFSNEFPSANGKRWTFPIRYANQTLKQKSDFTKVILKFDCILQKQMNN